MKKNDVILIFCIISIASIIIFGFSVFFKEDGAVVVVQQDGIITNTYSLLIDREIIIGDLQNDHNILVIKDGYASISQANCPDSLCVRQQKINKQGELIVCLPHGLVIKIDNGEKTILDGVTN